MRADPYDEVVASACSVRFEPKVLERLNAFVGSHPGLSLSAAGNLLVDEGLRSAAHPLVAFVDGPSGRRARLNGGPDVDRIIRALLSTQEAQPDLSVDDVLDLVADTTGVPAEHVRLAIEYWAEFPEDVDARIEEGRKAESEAREQWQRAHDLAR